MAIEKKKVNIKFNSNKLILQLEVIAKHAKALAEDLERIEDVVCLECGDLCDIEEIEADGGIVRTTFGCPSCGYAKSKVYDD